MGSSHSTDTILTQPVQDRDRQRSTFIRIRSGTELVEEHQGLRRRMFQNGNDVGHMGGEGTETLLDTLLITDVRIDIIKNSQFGSILCRNMQTRLSHQGEQTNRFQGDCLTTCVRSGDDQQVEGISQMHIDGNDFFGIQKWVTSLPDADASFCIKNRCHTVLDFCQVCFCKNKIKVSEDPVIIQQVCGILCSQITEFCQNCFNGFLFF